MHVHEPFAQLGIRYPILQAPMVGVSTPRLAAEVSNAGALGAIGLGASTPAQGRDLIRQTRALTLRPFNVNVFCHRPAVLDGARNEAWLKYLGSLFAELGATPPCALQEIYTSFLADRAMLDMLLEERPSVVSFHFGVPVNAWVDELKAAGIYTLGCATTLQEACQLAQAGVQAIVAQGYEAGGHRGVFDDRPGQDHQLGLFALLRAVVSQVDLPAIAAGGIMEGAGIAAALDLGAVAAQLGTAFVGCPESAADDAYRAALAGPGAYHTRMTAAVSGRPARALANRFTALVTDRRPPDYPIAYDAGKALHAAARARGEHGFGAQWAGQGAPLARPMPAAALVATLRAELQACRADYAATA